MRAPPAQQVSDEVARALAEDIGTGDCTAALIPEGQVLSTRVLCRDEAVLCGRPWFDETFRQLNGTVTIEWRLEDGARMQPDSEVCCLQGPARTLLSGERTALNFLQTLSGTASAARRFADAVAGTSAVILDTRKTLPGLRLAQKYAVRCGGASNHRIGLFDAFLVKENHIAAAGSISAAVREAHRLHPGLLLEVEVESLEQLEEASAAGAGRVLLDNFDLGLLKQAVARYKGRIELEASGGITLHNVRSVAETGVDFISIGAITKDVQAVDFSMRFLS
jgi:nicotinate-nucleotide pyrophosphorylase (carboxylating)